MNKILDQLRSIKLVFEYLWNEVLVYNFFILRNHHLISHKTVIVNYRALLISKYLFMEYGSKKAELSPHGERSAPPIYTRSTREVTGQILASLSQIEFRLLY